MDNNMKDSNKGVSSVLKFLGFIGGIIAAIATISAVLYKKGMSRMNRYSDEENYMFSIICGQKNNSIEKKVDNIFVNCIVADVTLDIAKEAIEDDINITAYTICGKTVINLPENVMVYYEGVELVGRASYEAVESRKENAPIVHIKGTTACGELIINQQ